MTFCRRVSGLLARPKIRNAFEVRAMGAYSAPQTPTGPQEPLPALGFRSRILASRSVPSKTDP